MANTKSIIEVDLKDDAFKAHVAAFQKYQSDIRKTKNEWGATGKAIGTATNSIKTFGSNIANIRKTLGNIKYDFQLNPKTRTS